MPALQCLYSGEMLARSSAPRHTLVVAGAGRRLEEEGKIRAAREDEEEEEEVVVVGVGERYEEQRGRREG